MARDHRRLAAIVLLDVVGYSRLMGVDDSGTLAALKAHRRELIDPKIAEHDGRIVKGTGDGLLLEFSSVVDAVRCAVDVQRGMALRNEGVAPDKRLEFRIGINVGDIIIDGDDIFGDGVNVAARLETLAEPGGICVSRVVRDQVLDKLSFTFEELGAQQVKNIARPVEAYRIELGSGVPQAPRSRLMGLQRFALTTNWRRLAAGVVIALGVVAVAVSTLSALWKPPLSALSAPALSIAIMPFDAHGGAPEDAQLAERLTRDLTTALGGMRWARVASHNLAATYQGKSVDARSVGHELNVRYVLNGAVHRAGDGVTVSAQLVEARNGAQAWNDRLEFADTKDASAKQMLVAQLTGRLATALWNAERNRATAPPPTDASAMDIVLHGWNVWTKDPNSLKGALEARKLFDRALAQEPGLVPALVGRTTTIEYELDYAQRPDRARLLQELDDLTFRAVNIDSNDSGAWLRRGDALLRQHRWEGGFQAIASARRLEPTWVLPLIAHGSALVVTGRSQEAVGLIDQALALHPQDNQELGSALIVRCHANLALGRYDEAISDCEGSAAQDDSWWARALLTAAYAQKGDGGQAAIEKGALLRQRPQTTIARLRDEGSDHPLYAQQREAHIYAGLRKAGIPEQ